MAVEEIGRLRSIAIVGQGATGKTQLAEAMLFTTGALSRLGRPDDGTAAMDFEPEELHRKISISSAFHHYNWKKDEVIVADTPGYQAFLSDSFATMRAVDGVVFVATPGGDLKVESEKIWSEIEELGLPRIAFISRLDRERTNFDHAMADLEKSLKAHPVALTLPIGSELTFNGVIDVLAMKALIYVDANGRPREEALTDEQKTRAEVAQNRLCEAVAETDDALLEKYLDKGVLEDDELRAALRAAVIAGKLTPVLCGSGLQDIRIGALRGAPAGPHPAAGSPGLRRCAQRTDRARAGPGSAVLGLCLQDRHRSVRRQAVDFPRGLRARHKRRRGAELHSWLARALRPIAAAGGQEAVADRGRAAGRDRSRRQA